MDELTSATKAIGNYSSLIFKIGIVIVILSTLFLFSSLTTELYDTPKFLVLTIFTLLMLLLLTLRFTLTGKVVLTRTPLDIPLLLLLAVATVSTFLSPSPYVSALGNQLRINGSLVSIAGFVLFYFVLVNSLKGIKDIKWVFVLTIIAAQVLSIITLLAYAGVKLLPPPWVTGLNFTPTGSSFSTTAILALLIPMVASQILKSSQPMLKVINALFLTLMGITIALTGSWATWAAAVLGLALTFLVINPVKQISRTNPISLVGLLIPIAAVVLVAILSFVPPMGGAKNPLYTAAQNFPREIQLDLVSSWKISISAFRDLPFWGSGPATYLFDFTNYKPVEFNSTKFWTLRFDAPFNEYLQTLATLGAIGLLALLSLTALFVSSAYKVIMTRAKIGESNGDEKAIIAIAGLSFFIILALHPASFTVWVIGLLVLASFMVVNSLEGTRSAFAAARGNIMQTLARVTLSSNSSEETIKVDALPAVLLTLVLILILPVGYFGSKLVLADYHHRLALNADAQGQTVNAYNELVATEKLNPVNDTYSIDLAKINFTLANAIAAAKGPTEASPAGSLTDQDKQNIQVLLQQSINEGRKSVTLSPKSAINWEILALLYRQIAGVAQNALVFSLDSYGRAILQDPLNPQLRINVGGVYYAVKNYDMAIRFFTDAINLKPDFANAYYNLSVALKDKGDLTNAQSTAEKVLTLVDKSSADYQVINNLLSELKKAQDNKTASTSVIEPPAAKTEGALQNKDLPKVVDVGKTPDKIATPAAVKKPAATSTPAPTANP